MKTILLAALLIACGSHHTVRFANAPAVQAVADRRDTPVAPKERPFAVKLYHFRGHVVRRVMHGMELRRSHRSLGINALDEVPDSTWFTNRIGVRDVSLDEMRDGPAKIGSPEAHLPWTIKGTKIGGSTIGFIIKDARGEKFILKFDEPEMPEAETATDVIVGRLLWAAGYNVPEDHVVYFRRSDLVLPPDATIKDFFGNTRRLTRAELDARLAKVSIGADGRIRGMASHFLEGKWLGGHPDQGVRADDPNDRVPHERRRDLRGARALFTWLDHVDVKEDNTVDMWVTDPANPQRHYVQHYLIDFGKSLGAMAKSTSDPRRGYSYQLDLATIGRAFVTAGLATRPWDGRPMPQYRGLGTIDAATFQPGEWKPNTPSYLPFLDADDIDGFWGAKLALRFSRAQIHAAVEAGRLTDPRSVEYLTDTLVERQRISARYWFDKVAPLDRFEIDQGRLCFDDLMLTYQLSPVAGITSYTVGTQVLHPTPAGRTCTAPLALPATGDGYTVVQIRTRRHTFDATTDVHVARRGGTTRIVGIWRSTAVAP